MVNQSTGQIKKMAGQHPWPGKRFRNATDHRGILNPYPRVSFILLVVIKKETINIDDFWLNTEYTLNLTNPIVLDAYQPLKSTCCTTSHLNSTVLKVKGSNQNTFSVKLGFCPNRLDPLPERWDSQKGKQNVYFAF